VSNVGYAEGCPTPEAEYRADFFGEKLEKVVSRAGLEPATHWLKV